MTNKTNGHVALIDSGIGGFSIMQQIERKIPQVAISYFMDNLFLPYGELAEQALLERLERIVGFLEQNAKPDLIVIACNTASTQSLCFLRERFKQTFVGVVPAVKPAALVSRTGSIGVLATPATVNGQYIAGLIENFAQGCTVQKLGSSDLVHLAEQIFWGEGEPDTAELDFSQFDGVDTVVLGCTHFPLIKAKIKSLLPKGIELVDSGEAIANRVASLLNGGKSDLSGKQLYASDCLAPHRKAILSQIGFDSISHVSL